MQHYFCWLHCEASYCPCVSLFVLCFVDVAIAVVVVVVVVVVDDDDDNDDIDDVDDDDDDDGDDDDDDDDDDDFDIVADIVIALDVVKSALSKKNILKHNYFGICVKKHFSGLFSLCSLVLRNIALVTMAAAVDGSVYATQAQ